MLTTVNTCTTLYCNSGVAEVKIHPNKDINDAIEYALDKKWRFEKSGKSSHAFGRLLCGEGHKEHQLSIWSTPRSPVNHARQIRKQIDLCETIESEEG